MERQPNRQPLGLAELLGILPGETIWGRLVIFAAANLAAQAVWTLQMILSVPRGVSASFPVWFWLVQFVVPIVFSLAAWAGLRLLRNVWAAAAATAVFYAVIMTLLRFLAEPGPFRAYTLLLSPVWVFLTLAGIALALRLIRDLLPALFLGSFVSAVIDIFYTSLVMALINKTSVSLPSDWLEWVLQIVSAAIFAVVFWAGLRLAMCRPELLGQGGAAEFAASPGAGSDLQRRFDFLMLRSRLRAGGIGSLIFGVLAIALGATSMQAVPANAVLVVLGVVLLAEGVWVLAAPSPAGLVVDGVVLGLIGLWNLGVSVANASAASVGGHFGVLGAMQIIWGIQAISQYRRYRHLAGSRFSAEEMRQLSDQGRAIWQADAGHEDLVDFTSKAVFSEVKWRAKLLPEAMILLRNGKPFSSVLKRDVELKTDPEKLYGDPVKTKLRLEKLLLSVEMPRRALDRLNSWKAVP